MALGVLLGALTLLAPAVLSTRPAAAAEPCVGVIVDARLLGGGVATGCAKGDPDSGLEALTRAGYGYAFVPRQPGLVCQIDGAPECSRTSTDSYWSYWYRAKGSSTWVYASQGAAGHDPAPGSTEAWVWQDGGRRQPPDIALRTICPQVASSPAATKAPAPSPTKSSSPAPDRTRTASASPAPRRSSSRKPGSAASGRTSEKPSTGASTSTAPTSTTAAPSSMTPSSPAPARATTTAGPAEDDAGDQVPWTGVAVGGGLIAALGGAALARSRRGGGP